VKDQVSHPYNTTGKITVFLYFNLQVFWYETAIKKIFDRIIVSIPRNLIQMWTLMENKHNLIEAVELPFLRFLIRLLTDRTQ
jgi:hypothetical protein